MKHQEQKLATYVYNHCNICNIPIYFCNIHLKHLQRTSKTSETLERYACNMRFSPFFHATQSKVGNGLFRPPVVEDGGAAWQQPAAPVPSLCSASDTPSSGAWPGRGRGRSTAWRGGDGGRFSHRAGAWNLEAEGEAPATRSSGNCSRWRRLAAYLGGEYLLSAGTDASRGMGWSHGVRRSREFFL